LQYCQSLAKETTRVTESHLPEWFFSWWLASFFISMSKELPYFRFTSFEWLNDDISLESYETKGVFIDICAYYWFKDCSITKAKLEQRFSNAIPVIQALLKAGIIKFKNGDDFLEISFLNKQFDQLSEIRKHRQDAGAKGGKQKASKAKAKLKQKSSYKDKDKDKDNISFDVFWDLYNKKAGAKNRCLKKWNKLSPEIQSKIIETLPAFISNIKDRQFQPYPETYLDQERWNDEIETNIKGNLLPTDPRLQSDIDDWKLRRNE